MLKLIPMALACDRPATSASCWTSGSGQRSFPGPRRGDHDLSHNAADDVVIARTNAKLSYLADLLRDMAAVREAPARCWTTPSSNPPATLSTAAPTAVNRRQAHRHAGGGGRAAPAESCAPGRHVRYDRRRLSD
jgi:hypothetical protein